MARIVSFLVLVAILVVIAAVFIRVMAGFFVPLFLAALLGVIIQPLYRWLLAAQVAFYLVWPLAGRLPRLPGPLKLLRLAAMFTSMNAALLAGFWRWLRGSQKSAWERTARLAETPTVDRPGAA